MDEFVDERLDVLADLVPDLTHHLDGLAGRIGELPVLVARSGKSGQASPQPMVTTTSAARTISSVHGLGNSCEMSMPISAMAATADGFTSMPGSDPPDQATARSPARWLNHPSAICERPALWTQRNRTTATPPPALPSTRASAVSRWRANRSAKRGRKLATLAPLANWS